MVGDGMRASACYRRDTCSRQGSLHVIFNMDVSLTYYSEETNSKSCRICCSRAQREVSS